MGSRENRRSGRARSIALAAGFALSAAAAPAETISLPRPGPSVLEIPFFVDRRLDGAMRVALEEAARRLRDERCREVLTDFTDGAGRRLDENLASIGQSMPDYLGLVLFYDGSRTEPCANERILAWTHPGARAVRVCESFFKWQRGDPGYAADIVIHEALHTLGLGERPPSPADITQRVAERCGR
jgi:hypothetical protein